MRFFVDLNMSSFTTADLVLLVRSAVAELNVHGCLREDEVITEIVGSIPVHVIGPFHDVLAKRAKELNVSLNISLPAGPKLTLGDAEAALVVIDKKVQAMRMVRDRTGCGLKEAKEAVDAYRASFLSKFGLAAFVTWARCVEEIGKAMGESE